MLILVGHSASGKTEIANELKRDYDMKEFNYEWVDRLEDVIPYIDNILRNPKRFIINDEEIVKVELAKRVTVESVIHLSQHTNLIQKIEDNGDVKPSKILNGKNDTPREAQTLESS